MGGRGVVNDEPGAVAALLGVLRSHGVARYERDANGAIRVEFYAPAPEARPFVAPTPPDGSEAPSADEVLPASAPRISSLPATDPLFDGVAP